jgi:putative transposase
MARPLRIEYDGAVYHVTSRGNQRKNIFRDDEDRLLFLDILKKVNEKHIGMHYSTISRLLEDAG